VSAKHEAGLKRAIAQYVANTAKRRSEEDWFAPQVFRLASRWLEENARQTPFFLLIDSFDPHEPWDPPQYYPDLYNPGYAGKNPIHPMYTAQPWCTESELTQMRANYCGEITMVDRWLGRFLEKIDDLGLRSNTAVAIISDHGHSLGDRGVSGKIPACQHRELVELVLMMRHPGGNGADQQSDNFVYNVDVVATLAAWAGVELTTQGRDLTPLVQGAPWEDRPFVTGALDNWVTYQDRTHKLIRRLDATDGATTAKLFDLRKDPQEQNNIAREEPGLVEELFQRILRDAGGEIPHYQMPTTFADGSTWHRSFMPDS
jgi:arylsulfatase A-like enzyme